MNFPLIYCNGDSYSAETFHDSMLGNTYAHEIGRMTNGFTINNAISGSCNRRIIRSSVHDLIKLRQENPEQKIIALVSLSFELRDEIWLENIVQDREPVESHFRTHQFSVMPTWRERLLAGLDVDQNNPLADAKFLKRWSEGRAFFYSPYAERINLMMDIFLFKTLLDTNNIQFLIFQGPAAEKLDEEYLLDFFKSCAQDDRIFDLEKFSLCDWCNSREYATLCQLNRSIAHYGPDAHRAFAREVIWPKLQQTGQL